MNDIEPAFPEADPDRFDDLAFPIDQALKRMANLERAITSRDARIENLQHERDKWRETAEVFFKEMDHWRDRCQTAELNCVIYQHATRKIAESFLSPEDVHKLLSGLESIPHKKPAPPV